MNAASRDVTLLQPALPERSQAGSSLFMRFAGQGTTRHGPSSLAMTWRSGVLPAAPGGSDRQLNNIFQTKTLFFIAKTSFSAMLWRFDEQRLRRRIVA